MPGEENPLCLEFDHDIGNKTECISKLIETKVTNERIEEEIKKCRILCSNCHQIKTAVERKSYAYFRLKEFNLFQAIVEKIEKLVNIQ